MGQDSTWITRGFEGFRQGTCTNAGQNLYVSRAGVLQRIHQYDLNQDGYVDLVFCNSQNHCEKPPAYVVRDPLGAATRVELPSDGARSGAVADLNGDGYADLIVRSKDGEVRVYWGTRGGFDPAQVSPIPVAHIMLGVVRSWNLQMSIRCKKRRCLYHIFSSSTPGGSYGDCSKYRPPAG